MGTFLVTLKSMQKWLFSWCPWQELVASHLKKKKVLATGICEVANYSDQVYESVTLTALSQPALFSSCKGEMVISVDVL